MTIKPATYWIGGSILTVALVYGLWALRPMWIKNEVTGDASPPNPEQIFNFADGSSIKIYDIQRGSIAHTFPVTSSGGSVWSGMSGSSSGSSGDGDFEVSYRLTSSQLSELTFTSNSNALLVEFRFCEYDDFSALPWVVANSNGGLTTINRSSQSRKQHKWTLEQMMDEDSKVVTPDFLIQIRDSDGKWVCGNIATPCDEDPWLRSVVAFDSWPSADSELEFRVTRKGFKPREFAMDNPDICSPKPWTSKPLPTTIDTPDYSLSLQSVDQARTEMWGNMVIPKLSVESKFKSQNKVMGRAFNARISSLETQLGESPSSLRYDQFPVDSAVEKIKVTAQVNASDTYPYPRNTAVTFAKGIVAADGSIEKLEFTNKSLGFTKIESTASKNKESANFEITGLWNDSREESKASKEVGGWGSKLPRVYLDSEQYPSGPAYSNGGSSSGSGDRTEFTIRFSFTPEKPLEPGQTVTLCYVQPPPPALHEFIIDRSDFSPLDEGDD